MERGKTIRNTGGFFEMFEAKFQIPNSPPKADAPLEHKFQILFSVFARYMIIAAFFALLIPSVASAADVTRVNDIRAATAFATSKGWCTTSDAGSKADCKRQKTICDDGKWADWISGSVEFRNGAAFAREFTPPQVGYGTMALMPQQPIKASISDEVITYLNKDPRNRSRIIPITEASCFCACGANDADIRCKGKSAGAPIPVRPSELFTREECMGACAQSDRQIADKCAGSLALIESIDVGSPQGQIAARSAETASNINALCFTTDECSKQDGIWEAWDQCKDGKGRCYAKEPIITLNTPIGGVTKVQGLNTYVVAIFRYMISIVAIVTTIMFIYGAFMYMLKSAIESIKKGKEIMVDAVVGLLLVLGATTILRTLNPNLLTLNPLKVYMVNTVQFIEAAYCSELDDGLKLADAGEQPSLKSYDELASAEGSFSVSPNRAACGHSFFVEGSIGQPCEGDYCADANEACISCADATFSECQGVPGARKVCAKLKFGGTINYADGRFPEEVYLIMVCGWAQGSTVEITESNIDDLYEVDLASVAHIVGTAKTEKDIAGQAVYQFDLSQSALAAAASDCSASDPQNGFRGAVLGVQYNDDTEIGSRVFEALVSFESAHIQDDMAIISKQNCGGGSGAFSGYASGYASDKTDLARAIQCGFSKNRLMNASLEYWSLDDLSKAARGEGPITCNFNLSSNNAPSNPGELSGGTFCKDDPNGVWRIK